MTKPDRVGLARLTSHSQELGARDLGNISFERDYGGFGKEHMEAGDMNPGPQIRTRLPASWTSSLNSAATDGAAWPTCRHVSAHGAVWAALKALCNGTRRRGRGEDVPRLLTAVLLNNCILGGINSQQATGTSLDRVTLFSKVQEHVDVALEA